MPIGTLLGLSEVPGELAGYRPIDADTARRIAAAGIWRRLLTDPASGTLLDYGRTTYIPPADLREFLLAGYPTCTFPGCRHPSRRCHLDHRHEWQDGGRTCAANLHPLCLRHHTCKTTKTWTVTCGPDGALTWTSPTGHAYTVPLPPLHPPDSAHPRIATGRPDPPGPCQRRDPMDETPPF